ncbi:NAD(P)-binding protein [Thozetella sp. PMI_491]|nr:NAD(P)-binding protein [Thozetella sp. PMI_491]
MSKTLAVFGATGLQGGSVIKYILNDPVLSNMYKIRAISRDLDSEKARQLKEKVEVVRGDVLDQASLESVLTGAHTVFAMTTHSVSPSDQNTEFNAAKRIADVALEKGVEYVIFSTLPSITVLSQGKYTNVIPFDDKAKAEKYIRDLGIKSAFYAPAFFMENFQGPLWKPQRSDDGTWAIRFLSPPETKLPFVAASEDSGKFIGSILAEPDAYEGKTVCAAVAFYTLEEIAAILSKMTYKPVVYKRVSAEDFKKSWDYSPEMFAELFGFVEEFGYFGLNSEKSVAWAAERARGRLTTLEEYLERHPLQL